MAGTPTDHLEVEWQFTAEDLRGLRGWLEAGDAGGYRLAAEGSRQLSDTYHDTEDWRLYRAGLTCRVRSKGDGFELTLKGMAEAREGMRSRREVNERMESAGVEAIMQAPGACGDAIRAVVGRRALRPLFRIETERETFGLSDAEGRLGEVVLDETAIIAGEGEARRLSRVEVEVDAGVVERAKGFVEAMLGRAELSAAGPSKFQAGLESMGVEPAGPAGDFGPTKIDREMTADEVAYAVLRRQFAAFLKQEPGTRLGWDIEALHDMRVAARRMRAAIGLFREYLPEGMEEFRDELAWAAGALGEVRDLDVQRERVREWRAELPERDAAALDVLVVRLERERREARERMLAALDDPRYHAFVADFAEALREGFEGPEAKATGIVEAVPGLLRKRYRRVRRRGDAIGPGSAAEEYHRLRIEAKRLRYAVEFVGEIYGKPARDFSGRVTALQDALGVHQDAEVAAERLRAMATGPGEPLPPEAVFVIGGVAERYRRLGERQRETFAGVYAGLKGRPWKDLRRALREKRGGEARRTGQ